MFVLAEAAQDRPHPAGAVTGAGALLVVEDNRGDAALIREMVREWPEAERLEVIHSYSLAAARNALGELTPVCILLDLGLPDASGLEVVVKMRAMAPGIPIVVLTGRDDDSIGVESLRSGAQDYLVKGQVHAMLLKRCVHQAAERLRMEEDLKRLALHDSLTGVGNAVLFRTRFDAALTHARERAQRLAVMIIDLDLFKQVNDHYGHAGGDEVLRIVSSRLQAGLRSDDTLARLGGDEFAVLCENASDIDVICGIAARLLAAVAQPIQITEGSPRVEASIGIAFAEPDAFADAVLRQADRAMYLAKGRGHGRYEVFGPDAPSGGTS